MRRVARVRIAAVLALAAALAAGSPVRAAPLADCRIEGIPNSVQCGVLARPLDPARPQGPQLTIHYMVVPAMARQKLADPVFLLAGGPGQSAIELAPSVLALLSRLNNRRDLVFVDQRGTGRSAPLECAAARREPLSDASDPERQIRRLAECRTQLAALPYLGGADGLRYFTTPIAVQDLDAVRRALGAEHINLIAASYGTRVALEYQRQFPDALRRAVLDGVAPPDMALPASYSTDAQAAFDAVFDNCAREPACAQAHPRLRADWQALLAGLPRSALVADPLTGQAQRIDITRDLVLGALRGPLYVPALAAALPAAIEAAAAGRYEALVGLSSLLSTRKGSQWAMGMHFSVVCAEDLPLLAGAHDSPGADFGSDFERLYRRVCADWPRGAVPDAFYRLTPSRSPLLLLSGGLDPATPPRHAARAAAALGPKAQSIVVPNAGHGVMGLGCMREVIFRFIDASDLAVESPIDASCATRVPRPTAFRPVTLPASSPR